MESTKGKKVSLQTFETYETNNVTIQTNNVVMKQIVLNI